MKKSQAIELVKLAMTNTYWDPEKILDNLVKIGLVEMPWYIPKDQPFTDPYDTYGEWSSVNEIHDWRPEHYDDEDPKEELEKVLNLRYQAPKIKSEFDFED
jgi:hypothetical protein